MKKVKWGVLGTADIARGCTIPGMQMAENCELYAVAGRSLEKAESFRDTFGFEKAYGDYESLLADEAVEAVYIPLPNHLHYEWVMKAMAAGKHVLCEKPLAPTAKQAQELFEAAKKYNVVLMEAFAYLHSPFVAALKEEVASGVLGDINYMESAFMTPGYDMTNIRMHKDMYGGGVYDLGCYTTSLTLWLMGEEPEEIKALAEFAPSGVDTFATAFLRFKNGARASLNCGMVFDKEHPARMDRHYIHGTRGYIKSDVGYNIEGDLSYTLCVDGKKEEKTVFSLQNYRLEVEQMGRCILDGEKPHVSAEFSILNAKVLDGILKAIEY